jgi:hypothetical protein
MKVLFIQTPDSKVVFLLGATDLPVSPQTNRMRYQKTFFCIQLETKKAQAKIF